MDVEEADAVAGQMALGALIGLFAELVASFARCVVDVHDNVCEAREVELVVLGRKLDPPSACRAPVFEREVAFVLEVELEEPRVVLAV